MPISFKSRLVLVLMLAGLLLACALTSKAAPRMPVVSAVPPPIHIASSATAAVAAVPTIIFADHHNSGWTHIPTVLIVGKQGDARIKAVQQAVQWWNAQLQTIGTPFHFGTVTKNTSIDADQFVPTNLRTADPSDAGNPVTGDLPSGSPATDADIVVALTSFDLTSRNMIKLNGNNINRDVILIKNFAGAGGSADAGGFGAVQHELGHALGLAHDSSTGSIMCGAPWTDEQGCYHRTTQVILDQDKQYILSLYPASWQPSP